MKVSVIVPVYRVPEAMLRACVESLLRQTLADMEFIFVVDGAEDPARPVLEAEARRDSRIAVLCSEQNQGVSASRNRGLEAARGEWFGFVDADDWVEPEMYEKLLRLAQEALCDLVGCGFLREGKAGAWLPACPAAGVRSLAADADEAWAFEHAATSGCSKLFRRDRLGSLRFDEALPIHEDIVFLVEALSRSERVGFIGEPLYHVCYRADSAHRRRIEWERFRKTYQALERLAGMTAEESEGRKWTRRLWAWRLLGWSVGFRHYFVELPAENREQAMDVLRRFYGSSLRPFHPMYPFWLRKMVERRMGSADRFFGEPGWYYSLLWQRIRMGMAPFQGKGPLAMAGDFLRRASAKVRG